MIEQTNALIITDHVQLEETLAEIKSLNNKKKYYLTRRDDQTAAQWLDLAGEYSKLASLANAAFCRCEAIRLGYVPSDDPETEPAEDKVDLEEEVTLKDIPIDEIFDWETRADIGDPDHE